LIIVTAKHGQSPIDIQKRTAINDALPASTVGPSYAFDISDDASLIWLKDPSFTAGVVANLSTPANQAALGIQEIFALQSMANKFNSPLHDERTPDILLKVNTGVIFTTGSKIAEHGGMNEDDVHVALLLSNPLLKSKQVKTPVLTQQVAPTILRTLRLDPDRLDSVRIEQIPVLPFVFSAEQN